MEAKDVMTTRVITAGRETPVEEIAKLLINHRISAVPVVDADGHILGIVSEGDLMRRPESGTDEQPFSWLSLLTRPEDTARAYVKSHGRRARDVMTENVVTVAENIPLAKIARILEQRRIKRVPVLRDGKIVGIVSRANLLQGLLAHKGERAVIEGDQEIRARILRELEKAGANTLSIDVVVSKGIVHLWGVVNSAAEKEAARVAAENVDGVEAVENHVGVLPEMLRGTFPV